MSKLPAIPTRRSFYPYLALILVLATLAPVVTPDHVVASSRTAGAALTDWPSAPSILASNRAMHVWLPPAKPVGAPRVRPLLVAINTVQIESPIGTEVITKSLTADEVFTFYAVGYNGVTSTQEVTWTLSVDVGTLSAVRGASTDLEATTVGSADLRAQLVTTPTISTTARITVTPGVPHHIVIRTGANESGEVAGTRAMTTDEEWDLYAAGYDADDNYLGDLSVNWSVTGDSIGVVAPTTGDSTVLDATRPGVGRVQASHLAAAGDETDDITVSVGAPSYITIRTGANESGPPAGSHTMTTDDVWQLYAAGYDADDNYLGDLSVNWSVTGGIGLVVPAVGAVTELDARRPGTGQVLADHVAAADGQTGDIDVSVGALHHIVIQDGAGSGGNEVTDHTMTIYDTYTVWATGYDEDDNYIAEQVVDWSVTGVLLEGQIEPSSGISTTFTPAPVLSGTGRFNATYQGPPQLTDTTGDFTVQAPRLVISKSDLPTEEVPAGQYLLYTVVFTNVGEAAARNVRITETYDSNVSYFSAVPYQPVNPPLNNVWAFSTLGPGASRSIYVRVLVAGSLVTGTVLNNLVTIGGSRLEQDTATESTVVTSVPSLTLTLTDQPDPVNAGDNLVYRLVFANQGNAPVHNLCITMTYDNNLTFLVSDPAPELGTDNVWCFEELPGGGSGDIDITVRVDDFMVDQDVLVSSVEGRGNETDGLAFAETVVNAPVLSITKSVSPEPAVAFQPLVYTLVYTNTGHTVTGALLITDAVPEKTSYVRCQPLPCSNSDGIVTWVDSGGLDPGESHSVTLIVNVARNLDTGTLLTNVARLHVIETPDYAAVAQIDTVVVSSPSLSLSISNGQSAVEAGDQLEYTVSYSNSGTGRAYDTTIVVTPPSSQYVEDVGCQPPSDCVLQGGQVIFNIGTLPSGAGGSGMVLVVATVRDPLAAGAIGDIVATAVIDTPTPGDPPGDNVAQDVDAIATRPDLVVVADYQDVMPYPGKRVTYTVDYSNRGHIATTGVAITVTQPQYTTYDPQASSPWQDLGDGHYRFPVGELGYNEVVSPLLFVVTLPPEIFTTTMTDFDATFGIYDDGKSGIDGQLSNNLFSARLGVPNLVIENVIADPSIWEGGPGYLTFTVRNVGTGLACGIFGGDGECKEFSVDVFLDPITPPASYPIERFGECFVYVTPIYQGLARTMVISFTTGPWQNQSGLCKATVFGKLWLHTDNWDPDYQYFDAPLYGLVPEYDEYDNVFGPVTRPYYVYLPVTLKNH